MKVVFAVVVALGVVLVAVAGRATPTGSSNHQQPAPTQTGAISNVTEEMHLIKKSFDDLLGELAVIRREASGRLTRNRATSSNQASDPESIRQVKVSRYVLRRVAELESESRGMQATLSSLLKETAPVGGLRQEDRPFEETPNEPSSSAAPLSSSSESTSGDATTESLPNNQQTEEEAAKIGFDVEALKKLGEELCKRIDQFGKEAAKQIGDLFEGIKLVFREPAKGGGSKNGNKTTTTASASATTMTMTTAAAAPFGRPSGDELDSELAARQRQQPESLRGVHEQVIRLVDNMVQNYLGNVRRTVQRMNQLLGTRRYQRIQQRPSSGSNSPRQEPIGELTTSGRNQPEVREIDFEESQRQVIQQIDQLSKQVRDFVDTWPTNLGAKLEGRQQSPLIDRIPPRGVELWRDFWDTMRRQMRRINQEFWQLSRDMTRMITGRYPSQPPSAAITVTLTGSTNDRRYHPHPRSAATGNERNLAPSTIQQVSERFQEFYHRMGVTLGEEQLKMDSIAKGSESDFQQANMADYSPESLIDEFDDEKTIEELRRNAGLRQQIRQEINVFSSIFDIMGAFIQRLRESANSIRNVVSPIVSSANNNDAVTPGPLVKPQIDQLVDQTINSQRGINSQAKPVLLPNARPTNNPSA